MIIDTSVLVDIDRGIDQEKLDRLEEKGPHSISSITKAELFTGASKRQSKDKIGLEKLLSPFKEISFKEEIAEKAGELIARKQTQDLSIGLNDIYISATAINKNKTVLTKDTEDFKEIDELQVQNWNKF